jgi:hypothetical protein
VHPPAPPSSLLLYVRPCLLALPPCFPPPRARLLAAFTVDFPAGHELNTVVPLFRVVSKEEVAYFRATYSGSSAGAGTGAGAGASAPGPGGAASVDVAGKNKKKGGAGAAAAAGAAPAAAPGKGKGKGGACPFALPTFWVVLLRCPHAAWLFCLELS